MRRTLLISAACFGLSATVATAAALEAGSRVLIEADGRDDYSPRIVACTAESGICLRDTRTEPADKPVRNTEHGQQVDFPEFGVVYLFRDEGEGLVFDTDGNRIGPFRWSQ